MVKVHAAPGEVIDVGPLGDALANTKTGTLFKSESMEVIRLVLPAGKKIAQHKAPGELTVQCIEGRVQFTVFDKTVELTTGTMLYLMPAELHALSAIENSSLLLFISLVKKLDSVQ